jgi:hypothetical protein
MDILLDSSGDLFLTEDGDIKLENSVRQKIRILVLWFEGEWRWNDEIGMPYRDTLLMKNPDTEYFEDALREAIFDIDEVTEVQDVEIDYDSSTREAVIRYTVLTDLEKIKEEMRICRTME